VRRVARRGRIDCRSLAISRSSRTTTTAAAVAPIATTPNGASQSALRDIRRF
jgi:hypothetical protein